MSARDMLSGKKEKGEEENECLTFVCVRAPALCVCEVH